MTQRDGSVWVLRLVRPYEGEELKGVYTRRERALQAVGELEDWARPDAEIVEVQLDSLPGAHEIVDVGGS